MNAVKVIRDGPVHGDKAGSVGSKSVVGGTGATDLTEGGTPVFSVCLVGN